MIDAIFNDDEEEQPIPLDFESLRAHGITLVQKMASNIWTDFNLHDPGVTILEQLCYAITDLAYQTGFDITDLLSDKDGKIDYKANSFFLRQNILSSNPVTVTDYRKAIIDEVTEIDNVWLTALSTISDANAMQGLYKITVQVKTDFAKQWLDGTVTEDVIKTKVRAAFCSKRNLCEDIYSEIVVLKPVEVAIQADIQIQSDQVAEEVLAKIYLALQDAINLPVRHYTEKEMLQKGYTIDQMYCGPLLKNGLIPDTELKDRQQIIDAANIIQRISNIDEVVLVKKLFISRKEGHEGSKVLTLADDEFAMLDILSPTALNVNLFVDKYRVPPIRKTMFADMLQKMVENSYRDYIKAFYRSAAQLTGTYHDNSEYYSLQHYFPLIYGIGSEGLLNSAPEDRKAQAKQLKGYLMLFEQILANYQGQLNHLNGLFSNDVGLGDNHTYFSKPLYNVPGAEDIIKGYTDSGYADEAAGWEKFKEDQSNTYMQALNNQVESDAEFNERKNNMLDHLLARFNESPVVYPVKLYNMLYRSGQKKDRVSFEIRWKASMLKDFNRINYNRARAFNYLKDSDPEFNFEYKMRKLLYIINNKNRHLTAVFDPDKVTFDKVTEEELKADQLKPVSDINDETDWNPEFQDIILNKKGVIDLIENNLLSGAESQHKDAFVFRDQDISILKTGININNYRIGPDPYQEGDSLVLYKSPTEERWNIISRYKSEKASAVATLKKLVNNLSRMSTRSEGFYLVEHVLLRPDLTSRSYGFKFYKDEHQVIFENDALLTFEEREDAIKRLFEFDNDQDFYLAQQNINIVLAIKQLHSKKWADRSSEFIKATEVQFAMAESIAETAVVLAEKAGPENRAAANANKEIAEKNQALAYANKDIADQFVEITQKSKVGPGTILTHQAKTDLEEEVKELLDKYHEDVERLLADINRQEYAARNQADAINNALLAELDSFGKVVTAPGNSFNDLDILFTNIKQYGQQQYPRLKMLVNVKDDKLVSEDFFSFNMSVVLPDWPARFQNLSFRSCVEGLFKYHSPAHLKLHIQWFNVQKMIKFEPIFLNWEKSLQTERDHNSALELIALLNDRSDHSHPH